MAFGFLVAVVALIFAEVVVIVEAVHAIGTLPTIALLLLVPFFGVRVVKREGLGALRRLQQAVANRELPGPPLLDAAIILVAGICLMVPGFITDAIGLLLLVPPVRRFFRAALRWLLFRRVAGTTIKYLP